MNQPIQEEPTLDYYVLDQQEIALNKLKSSGRILDLGGGGEGVIGLLNGKQVIAIDPSQKELEETAEGPLKIVMDARELQFLDESFEMVTSFFTLMYIQPAEHKKVLEEVYRVLSPGGRFFLWDLTLPERTDQKEDILVVILKITLPEREIETGYGTKWPEKIIDINHYLGLAQEVGFGVKDQVSRGATFFLELRK
jgi:ubiquinone/menaquinone biosynthesis C-methylase UbiE